MKLKLIIPFHRVRQVIQQFGQAKLIKLANGQHELIGGTDADRAAAFEWASLLAHEIVFTHYYREAATQARTRKYWATALYATSSARISALENGIRGNCSTSLAE